MQYSAPINHDIPDKYYFSNRNFIQIRNTIDSKLEKLKKGQNDWIKITFDQKIKFLSQIMANVAKYKDEVRYKIVIYNRQLLISIIVGFYHLGTP